MKTSNNYYLFKSRLTFIMIINGFMAGLSLVNEKQPLGRKDVCNNKLLFSSKWNKHWFTQTTLWI